MSLTAEQRAELRVRVSDAVRARVLVHECPGCGTPVPENSRRRRWCSRRCYNRNWWRLRR